MGLQALAEVARTLAEGGIALVPLKGIWLHLSGAYAAPERRPIADVDVLVAAQDYGRAIQLLGRGGFECTSRALAESSHRRAGHGLSTDLHRELFEPNCFGLSGRDMLAAADPVREVEGIPLRMPEPLDAFGHLVGHFVRTGPSGRDAAHCRDFETVLQHYQWDAALVAAGLAQRGLARAGRFALGLAARAGDSPRAAAVLASLAHDPVGEQLAALAQRLHDMPAAPARAHSIAGLLLARDVPAGVAGITRRLLGPR